MKLPITVVPGTDPPVFRWTQVVDTPDGKRVVDNEGGLPPSVERAVERLITIVKQLLFDNAALRGQVEVQAERLGRAELAQPTATTPPVEHLKKKR